MREDRSRQKPADLVHRFRLESAPPVVTGEGRAEVVLPVVRQQIRDVLMRLEDGWQDDLDGIVSQIVDSMAFRALVAQARADGAAEERERIAAACEAETEHYMGAEVDGLRMAADIARQSR